MLTRPHNALGWLYQPGTAPGPSLPSLGLQHWPLVPSGRVSNELINNSLVMNPAAHCELPTEHRQGLKSCESAKGSLELCKNCNWMELGEQNKLIKSFHWQNHCYRNFRWIMDLLGILNTNWPTFFKRLCWLWWMKEVGFVTDTQDSKTEPFRMPWGGKNLGIPVSRHLLALLQVL